jgi:hypothetical protein
MLAEKGKSVRERKRMSFSLSFFEELLRDFIQQFCAGWGQLKIALQDTHQCSFVGVKFPLFLGSFHPSGA